MELLACRETYRYMHMNQNCIMAGVLVVYDHYLPVIQPSLWAWIKRRKKENDIRANKKKD